MLLGGFEICRGFLADLKKQSKLHRSTENDLAAALKLVERDGIQPHADKMRVVENRTFWKIRVGIAGSKIGKSKGFRLVLMEEGDRRKLVWLYTHAEFEGQPPFDEILKRLED